MMPGHSTSTRIFNPLDILANAASLIPKTMTPQQDTAPSETPPTSDNVSTTEDLEKMFDEHNYGNAKKVVVNKISHSSFSSDFVPQGKEGVKLKDTNRRVIVTVVNRSGDQRVVKTFSSVKSVKSILQTEVCVDKQSEEEAEKQEISDAAKTPEPVTISLSEKSKQNKEPPTDVISHENGASPVSVNSKSIDIHQAVQNTCENETEPNTSIAEKTGSNSSHPLNKEQVNSAQVTRVNTNSLEEQQGESSSVTCPSSHQSVEESSTCKQSQKTDDHSPSQDDISETRPLTKDGNSDQNKESDCTGVNSLELNNLKMTVSSPGPCFEGSSVGDTDNCAIHSDNRPSDISDSENRLHSELSGKKEFIGSPEGCCFKLCEDVSDSESWRYEGNRGDIRLSLDLDSPKSERTENPSPASEMGRTKTLDTSLDSVSSPNTDEDNSECAEGPKCSSAALISNIDHCYAGPTFVPQQEEKNEENSVTSPFEDSNKNGINLKDLLRNHKNTMNGSVDKGHPSDINQMSGSVVSTMVSEPPMAKTVQTTAPKEVSPKFGKYRIGTFASVSNTAMGLESPTKKKGPVKATSLLTNTVYTNNVPLVVTQGARTSQFSDLTLQQVLERKWVSVTDHDHDYCLPRLQGPIPSTKIKKAEDKRVKKVVQTDSTDTESNDEFIQDEDSQPSSPLPAPTTRQRTAKSEKVADYIKGGTSDSKLKITGKYQDDYIYFLNTKLRSRRRTTSVDEKSVPLNKIMVPLPKPGDIVVPHLTDADLELIKSGNSDKIPQQMCSNTDNLQALKSTVPPQAAGTNSSISDEESKLINTILSMETGDQNPPVPVSEIPNFGEPPALFGGTNDDILNLTPEQMEILYNAMDEVQSESPDISSAENKFNLEVPTSTSARNFPVGESEVPGQQMLPTSSVAGSVATPTATTSSTTVTTGNTFSELPTIPAEKSSLDLFGSELKLFPEPPVESSSAALQKPAQPTSAGSADTSAPWIVTVSMYWNDLPAIMIDNAPFVRLVDIHKQILPAKDTGILKKRCQLLGIEVLNCTEMQRYFLVQYGKAFNSKSTLIISKDDAKSLIGYYVNPGSHPPRVRCRTMGVKTRIPVQNNSSKKTHSKAAVEFKEEVREINPLPAIPPPRAVPQQPQSRTRHKKINFLEMLKGDTNNNTTDESEVEVKEESKPEKPRRGASKHKMEGESKSSAEKKQKVEQNDSLGDIVNSNSEESGKNKSDLNKLNNTSLQPKKLKFEKSKKYPGPLKVKWTVFNSSNKQQQTESEEQDLNGKENILSVVHKDMTLKNGQRGRMQAGNVFLDLYKGPLAPCIRCCTCEKLFSIDNFLKHLHDVNGSNKLLVVRQPQTFALRDLSPSVYQKKLWEQFFKKRKAFNEELKQKRVETKEKTSSLRNDSQGVSRNADVRISGRKRRPKQLHPIENYRYNLPKGASSATDKVDSLDAPSPSKMRRTMDTSTMCEDNSVDGDESVVTLTNGPEVISFTALEGAFDV